MTDYYALLARAVSNLENNSGESRRELYTRARTALVAQLRGLDPPLTESEITRERLALEESIRKVEFDNTRPRRPSQQAKNQHGSTGESQEVPRSAAQEERPNDLTPRPAKTPVRIPWLARLFNRRRDEGKFDPLATITLETGVIEGTPYRVYADGSIAAEFPQGLVRFNALAELEDYLARMRTQRTASTNAVSDPLAELARLIGQDEAFGAIVRNARTQHGDELQRRRDEERRLEEFQRQQEEEAQRREEELQRQRDEEKRRREAEEELLRQREEENQRRKEESRLQQEKQKRLREANESHEAASREARVRVFRAELAEAASPAPSIAPDGRLDAGPNEVYDAPADDTDLPSLPLQQRALIKTIVSDLPRNAPKYLKVALDNYDDELKARGVQPVLGLLKDMAAIIESAVGASDAREWLDQGMFRAFTLFASNHALFVKHFPLDPRREALYARTPVDEGNATGSALSRPFQEVAEATSDANKAGIATDDFLRIVDRMAEFARIIATLPPPAPARQAPSPSTPADNSTPTPLPSLSSDDKVLPDTFPVSARKRMLLSGLGFIERAYNLLGSTASLMGIPGADKLLKVLQDAASILSKLIG